MFVCNNCGEVFDEPATYEECVGEYWGQPAYETWAVCPSCKDEDFTEYDEYERCWAESAYDDQDCEMCPHNYECSGYKGDDEDD